MAPLVSQGELSAVGLTEGITRRVLYRSQSITLRLRFVPKTDRRSDLIAV